ncbi:hypothetical protein RRG08_005330, partial [Elysia crispata]
RREDQPDEDIMFRSMVQVEERISQMKTLCFGSMVQSRREDQPDEDIMFRSMVQSRREDQPGADRACLWSRLEERISPDEDILLRSMVQVAGREDQPDEDIMFRPMVQVYGPGRREDQPDEDIMFRSMVQVEESRPGYLLLCAHITGYRLGITALFYDCSVFPNTGVLLEVLGVSRTDGVSKSIDFKGASLE